MLIVVIDVYFTRGGILLKRNFWLAKHDFYLVRIVVIILVVYLYYWLTLFMGAVPFWYTYHRVLLIRFPHSSLPKINLLVWTCFIKGMLDVLVRSLRCRSHLQFSWDHVVDAILSPVHKCPITPMTCSWATH